MKLSKLILAHDLGTTNHKCIVFNEKGNTIAKATRKYPSYYLQGGVVEQDPNDWWSNFLITTSQVLKNVNPKDITVISFSAHMNGCLPIDSNGKPLTRSFIHADTRSGEYEEEVFNKICEDQLYEITGNRIDSHYPLLKMYWLKKRHPDIYKKTSYFLQAKDYLVFKLTGKLGFTDYSDASLTGALNLKTRKWEQELFSELGLDVLKMPTPLPSTAIVGFVQKSVAIETGLIEGTPVVIGGGDGACATIGAGCVNEGDTYISLGTTAWVSKVVSRPFIDQEKRVFNICDLNPNYYNVLGTMQTAGAAYEWAIKLFSSVIDWDQVKIEPEYDQFEKQIKQVPAGSRGLIFHPYLLGERSPIWNGKIRGSFFGMSLEHNRFDFARAVLEGIAYSLGSIYDIINNPISSKKIRMIGGLVDSDNLNQIISDVLENQVQITSHASEAASIGAAIAGGVGINLFTNFETASEIITLGQCYEPNKQHNRVYLKQKELFKELYLRIKDISFVDD